ncbi:hypothetical protein VNO77_18487 [Canavalia gladiata]|uniref:Uncharacterized protein n=1 Tax=Canavalia gladiata TaxID=3824 RepID=A0AAN9LPT8_CANGL
MHMAQCLLTVCKRPPHSKRLHVLGAVPVRQHCIPLYQGVGGYVMFSFRCKDNFLDKRERERKRKRKRERERVL